MTIPTNMTMPPGLRKLMLTIHLTSSIGWVGAVVAYVALGVSAVTSSDAQMVRAVWIAMELIGWFVIVPLALAALLTGVVMSLGTPWGLFRHYWVMISFVLTVFATVVLLLHMSSVSSLAALVRVEDGANSGGHGGDLFHAGVGLLVLVVVTVLNVYKPRGMTPYGWRKQREERKLHLSKEEDFKVFVAGTSESDEEEVDEERKEVCEEEVDHV